MRSRKITLAALSLAGCFHPRSGTYVVSLADKTSSSEGEIVDTGVPPYGYDVDVAVDTDAGTMTLSSSSYLYHCTLTERDFQCPVDPYSLDLSEIGLDQSVEFTYDLGGTWQSDRAFELVATMSSQCSGADCASGSTAVSELVIRASAELVE